MSTNVVSPSDDELKQVLVSLRSENANLGVPKLHALLLAANPSWKVSEKRTRRVLQNEGLILAPVSSAKQSDPHQLKQSKNEDALPSSKVIEGLDVSKWTPKVDVKYFGRNKGKGLVAKEKIVEGEIVWKEDPFALAPEWDLHGLQMSSLACAHCSTPLRDSPISIACASTSSNPGPSCPAKFCNRLCVSRSGRTHPLLCPAQNPASAPLLVFARKCEWMALHALAQCTARLLLTYQQDEQTWQDDWNFFQSLARMSMEERAKGEWLNGVEVDRETWKKAYQFYMQAFQDPPSAQEKKKLARILKKPLPKEVVNELFDYEHFLVSLGSMSLNIEAHGGIYVLHSHMNHACSPNISVRHLDQRSALSRITVIAKKDIERGEELLITYVNPDLPVDLRRRQIMEWGFGPCQCGRCVAEADGASPTKSNGADLHDLELELKAGLGVI